MNWFYANFPSGNWATSGTVMTTANVSVVNSPNQANLRQVTVTASTNVPTWFMKYLGFNLTSLTLTGQASRRDVVAMLVLDRSGSMCSINGATANPPCGKNDTTTPCSAMITAAKNFTGAFAEGRDQIGMLTFSDGYYLDRGPPLISRPRWVIPTLPAPAPVQSTISPAPEARAPPRRCRWHTTSCTKSPSLAR